jgi:hypothetical protein
MSARRRPPLPRVLLLLVLLCIVSAGLPLLAYASPADPSWIPGIYDDADYDDVVALVTSGAGHVAPLLVADLRPYLPLIGGLPQRPERAIRDLSSSPARPRGPPVP